MRAKDYTNIFGFYKKIFLKLLKEYFESHPSSGFKYEIFCFSTENSHCPPF